jgi:hypothetical protein
MGRHASGKGPGPRAYAKFFVAGAGFVTAAGAVVGNYLATGGVDVEALIGAGITFLTAIGVYQVPNKKELG